jgi:hypothetical protein
MEWVPFYQTEIFTIKQQIKTFHFKIKSGMCDGVLIVTKEKSHNRGRRDHCRMVVGFITTYAMRIYHHQRCEFESRSGEVYSIKHYVIEFVSDLRHVGGFLRLPPPIKLTSTM